MRAWQFRSWQGPGSRFGSSRRDWCGWGSNGDYRCSLVGEMVETAVPALCTSKGATYWEPWIFQQTMAHQQKAYSQFV
jgi:hypothetical protein